MKTLTVIIAWTSLRRTRPIFLEGGPWNGGPDRCPEEVDFGPIN